MVLKRRSIARSEIRARNNRVKSPTLLAAVLLLTAYAQAQTTTETDTGYITDASGVKHPVKISRKPQPGMVPALCGGTPCFAQLPSPTPNEALTDAQKQSLSSPDNLPKIILPADAPLVVPLPKPVDLQPAAMPSSDSKPGPTDGALEPKPSEPINSAGTCDTQCQQARNQQAYREGYSIGSAIGSSAVEAYRLSSYCKANPTSTFIRSDGVTIPCPRAPLDNWERTQIDQYCRDNPGSWMAIGKRKVDCLTPPNPPNLKWAKWELNAWQWDYRNQAKAKLALSGDEIRSNWNHWKGIYCSLAESAATFKDLNGKKHRCAE